MIYEDFTLQVLAGLAGRYTLLTESPGGLRGDGSFGIPDGLGGSAWETLSHGTRDLPRPAESGVQAPPTAREVGDLLFRTVFTGKVRAAFDQSLGAARARGRGLRIRLRIDPQAGRALALPWELLRCEETEDFLGLDRNTPIVRCLDVLRSAPVHLERQLRILAIASAPRGLGDLDLERERQHLKSACKDGRAVELKFLQGYRMEDLRSTLIQSPFHVLHFMGHGTFDVATGEGALQFEGPDGGPIPVTGGELALELQGFPGLRLVVLNACQTARMAEEEGEGLHPFAGVASALLKGGIPAVIAMRASISDKAAIAFSQRFYQQLATGEPVDAAVTEGRMAIRRKAGENGGWNLPVLFLLGKDGEIFRGRGLRPIAKAWSIAVGLVLLILFSGFAFRKTYRALESNNLGVQAALDGKDPEARTYFLAALKLDPDYAAAHTNLAGLEERSGNCHQAEIHARAAVHLSPGQAMYAYNLGRLLVRCSRDSQEALDPLRQATELDPCYAVAFNEMANVYLDLGRPADAGRAVEKGLRCDPDLPFLHKNLGRVALEEGRPEAAVNSLEEAVRLYARKGVDDAAEPTYWLAEAYAQAGRRRLSCERLAEYERLSAGVGVHEKRAQLLAQREACAGVL